MRDKNQRLGRGCAVAVLLFVAPLMAYLMYFYLNDFLPADSCLDRGGSFHYDRGFCSFTENYEGKVPALWPF